MTQSNQDRARKVLKPYRIKIDALDKQILKLLGRRFDIVRKVAEIKVKAGLPSFLHDRVEEVRNNAVRTGTTYGIDPAFVYSLYSAIIYQSCATEDKIKSKKKK